MVQKIWIYEYTNTCSTLLISKKYKLRPQWNSIWYLSERWKLRHLTKPSVEEDLEQEDHLYNVVETVNW